MLNTHGRIYEESNQSVEKRKNRYHKSIDKKLLLRCRESMLEYAYRFLGLTYLSDIKQSHNMIRFIDLILEEHMQDTFSPVEYQRAVSYIVGHEVQGNSHEQNITFLKGVRKVFLFDLKQREF